jgi:phosphoribosylformylglycinamidine cyclo-ligase
MRVSGLVEGGLGSNEGLKEDMSTATDKMDYRSAGVDIDAGNEAVRRIKAHVARTHTKAVLTGLGSFGSMFSLRDAVAGMDDPVMVQSTDGCGTKTIVSAMAGRYEDLGRDLVAAVAGDIVVMGARPLTFLDYLGLHRIVPETVEALVRGMSSACEEAGIALVGGETAEMPAVYAEGDLDVVGFVTGVVDRAKLLTGASIKAGDVLYGVNSSGLHTNGFSLARKILFERGGLAIDAVPEELEGKSLADALLAPHANYVAPVRAVLEAGVPVKGMAHITGGGLLENVPRVLPEGLGCVIDRGTWTPQPIFRLMQRLGNVDETEMLRTFNMGVGLVMIAPPGLQAEIAAAMTKWPQFRVWELGRVETGSGVKLVGGAA